MPDHTARDDHPPTAHRLSRRSLLAASARRSRRDRRAPLRYRSFQPHRHLTTAPRQTQEQAARRAARYTGDRTAASLYPLNRRLAYRITARARRQWSALRFRRVLARLAEIRLQGDRVRRLHAEHQRSSAGRSPPPRSGKILDDNGLVANGTHASIQNRPPSSSSSTSRGTRHEEHRHRQRPDQQRVQGRVGAPPPTSGTSWAAQARARGMRLYTTQPRRRVQLPDRPWPARRAGPGGTRWSGIRRLEYFFVDLPTRGIVFL